MTTRFFVILLCLVATPAFGQSTTPLPVQQTQEYKQNSLSVDLSGLQVATTSGEALEVGCTRCWTPYMGYEKLSEADFFEISGERGLAYQAKRSRRNTFLAIGLGGLSMIAGTILLSRNIPNQDFEQPQIGSHFVGVLLIGGGGATVGYSAVKLRARSVSYSIAQDVAQQYNHQLVEELGQVHD